MYSKVEYFERLDFKDLRTLIDVNHPFDIIITSETYIGYTYDEDTGDFDADTYESSHIKVEMIFKGNIDNDNNKQSNIIDTTKQDLDCLSLLKSMMKQ